MKKHLILNALGVVCLAVLCSCGEKKEEAPKAEATVAVAMNETEAPKVEGAEAPATTEATTEAAAPATTEEAAPATTEATPAPEEKA